MRRYAAFQSIGGRRQQEDSFLIDKHAKRTFLFGVFDGMGGHALGRDASQLASKTVKRHFKEKYESAESDELAALLNSLNAASNAIAQLPSTHKFQALVAGAKKSRLAPPSEPGTTAALGLVKDGKLHWAHAGDSSISLFRGGKLTRLNEWDKSYPGIPELVNIISKKLPLGSGQLPETDEIGLNDNDIVLLNSDGLECVPSTEVQEILSKVSQGQLTVRQATRELVSKAEFHGREKSSHFDNITVVLYHHKQNPFLAFAKNFLKPRWGGKILARLKAKKPF